MFYYLSCLNRATIVTMSIQDVKSSIHVTIAYHPLCGGAKKPHPRMGEYRLPWHGSATDRIPQNPGKVNKISGRRFRKKPSVKVDIFPLCG